MKSLLLVSLTIFAVLLVTGVKAQVEGVACSTSAVTYVKDPGNDCSIFFQCRDKKLYQYRCATGLVFDSENMVCVFPSQYTPCKEFTPADAVTKLRKIDQSNQCVMPCPATTNIMYPRVTAANIDCLGFYVCLDGDLYEGSCGDVGSKFIVYDSLSRACSQTYDQFNPNCVKPNGRRRKRSPLWRNWIS